MRRPEEYLESLRLMRPNIYKFGELIKDVTTHPATKRCVMGHARIYEESMKEENKEIFTTYSDIINDRISRYLSVMKSVEDAVANVKLKRFMFNIVGTCTGGRCVGWNCINAMWATTYEMDDNLDTDYHERLKKWLAEAQKMDITLSGALTDPKGVRILPPSMQEDKDMYLRVVEKRDDGIVVRGAKVMIAGVAAANEIFVMPGQGMKKEDEDYAVSFAIPRDAERLTIVEARHPEDEREHDDNFDMPMKTGISQSYLFFDDVFVPHERIFMCGEYEFAGKAVMNFIMPYRAAIGGCVAGQGDVMVGAALMTARMNGIPEKVFNEKITQMIINNETTFGIGIASAFLGTKHPSGAWLCDPLLANVNKVHVATLPYETKRLTQEIAGGIGETGCMPSFKDYECDACGEFIRKYLKASGSAEDRMRTARLVEWLTIGAGVPGCMHGGGSPEGAKMMIRRFSELKKFMNLAKDLAGVSEIPKEVIKNGGGKKK